MHSKLSIQGCLFRQQSRNIGKSTVVMVITMNVAAVFTSFVGEGRV